MSSDLTPLLEPLKLGPSLMKNRIIMGPLTRSRAVPTNVPNDVMLEYYVQRAKGGAGLIISEGTLITQQGTEWENAPGIWNQQHIDGWKKITEAVHREGAVMFCQLWHVGRLSHPDAPEQKASGNPVYGPSAIAARGYPGKFRFLHGKPGYVTPTAIEDPKDLVELYRQGAINAKAAGFDGVELHGAHGYLIHQFLDSTSNKRTDSYGGSIENRARFGLEALAAAVDVWGPGRVAIKMSPTGGGNDMGMPLKETLETFTHFIQQADKLNLAYFCLLRYIEFFDVKIDGAWRATVHDVLSTYRPFINSAALLISGDVSPEEGASLVASGQVDAAIFGRPWICQPDVGKRIAHGIALESKIDMKHLYLQHLDGSDAVDEVIRRGYTDYPAATYT